MSSIPATIPELGNTSQALRANPHFDAQALATLTTRDYYVLSRIDGSTSVHDLILMIGFEPDETIAILHKLRQLGAVLLPGEPARDPAAPVLPELGGDGAPTVASPAVTGPWAMKGPSTDDVGPFAPAPGSGKPGASDGVVALGEEETRALAENVDIPQAERRRIVEMRRVIARGDFGAILGVGPAATKRDLKRAYFRLSKEFHPDRYYGVEAGSFGPWLSEIFEGINRAYEALSAARRGPGAGATEPDGGAASADERRARRES